MRMLCFYFTSFTLLMGSVKNYLPSYLVLPFIFLFNTFSYFYHQIFIRHFPLFLMFQESSDPFYISNPCYPEGFNTTIKASSIYDTKCTKTPRNYNPNKEFLIVGGGSSDECERVVKSLFDFRTCLSSHCSFNGIEMPPVDGEFLVKHDASKTQIY